MAKAVNGGCVDPVDAEGQRATDRGDRSAVVLAAPADRPVAAHRPGTEAHLGNSHVGSAKSPNRKGAFSGHELSSAWLSRGKVKAAARTRPLHVGRHGRPCGFVKIKPRRRTVHT